MRPRSSSIVPEQQPDRQGGRIPEKQGQKAAFFPLLSFVFVCVVETENNDMVLFVSLALGGRTHSPPQEIFGSKIYCSPSRSHSGVAAPTHGPAHRHNYDDLAVRAHDEQRRISFFICLTRRPIARRDAQSTRRWTSRRSRHVGVVAHGSAHVQLRRTRRTCT